MTRKQRRIGIIAAIGVVLSSAAGLTMYALRDAIVFFHTPSEAQAKGLQPGQRFRLGGLVAAGSVDKGVGERVAFAVTDGTATLKVNYVGILPDLFREGQGVVAEGVLQPDGTFRADTVLAKHDENYMPKEVADSLRKQGHWKDGQPSAGSAVAPAAGTRSP